MYTIMIVDDEVISQEIIQEFIESHLPDYRVISCCCTGQEALETFQRNPVDIVLTDIRMPIMDGLTLIEQLNKISKIYIPIIISSYSEFEYAKSAMRLGVTYFLLKPLDFKELTHTLTASARSLDLKHLTRRTMTWLDDNQELYMINLLSGKYHDRNAAAKDFSALDFPFTYEGGCGICLQIDLTNTDNWIYGKETLVTAITNLINLLYAPLFLLPLFRQKFSCDYLLIKDSDDLPDFTALTEQVSQMLEITISVHPLFHFSSLEQLRNGSFNRFVPEFQELSSIPEDTESQNLDRSMIQTSIENAIAYMKEHYMEDISRDDVAEKIYMSGAHFSRCFKMVTNTSYKDYLTEIRMQKAIELLKTNMKIQDIALQVGYPAPNRFNINFRHYTSYSPTEYLIHVLKMI